MSGVNIFQIFFDEQSKKNLDPGFIPLDNTESQRKDWYEFYVILDYLRNNTLNEGEWYGFLSHRLKEKTGFSANDLISLLRNSVCREVDVALIYYEWFQIAYFENPFFQGEYCHPGFLDLSDSLIKDLHIDFDVRRAVGCTGNFTFSNFIIAKKSYWEKWLEVAERLYNLIDSPSGVKYSQLYHHRDSLVPFKVFFQERLPFVLISNNGFVTSILNSGVRFVPLTSFEATDENLDLLRKCDDAKIDFLKTKDVKYAYDYFKYKSEVVIKRGLVNHEFLDAGH